MEDETAPWVVDVLFGVFVTLAIALIIATDRADAPPGPAAYAFAIGFGALMLVRRRTPKAVLVATTLGLFAYYTMGYPAIGVAIPVVAALYSAAELGLLRPAIGTAVVVVSVSWFFRFQGGEPAAYLLGYELISNVALLAAAIALGDGVRSRRVIRRDEQERLTREAERRLQTQREMIARDLHDSVGHTMSVIALQTNVAAEAIARGDSTVAVKAVGIVRDTGEQTMRELRSTVKLLRTQETAVVSLRDLDGLIASAEATGLTVRSEVDTRLDRISPAIDAAAYRIVQEALTNVIRHAQAQNVRIALSQDEHSLRLEVSDDGHGGPVATTGHGLRGMSERARLLGGSLTAAPENPGFTVTATLPARLA
ncbi:MAG: sensor histidine kinase [Hamadaea sp.]|uniref:sensor histidine kinase n=1 Tax=Hamadaea sp. TaxID=2024425 RepID=UPI001809B45B|nr:sensor histidine kinase [Hamadaea sp.]NUR73773.1 sensor histidine kinase [Hamadaea sp.]NUT18200.1 sensor histidine kinase [Hamadaea sp.]